MKPGRPLERSLPAGSTLCLTVAGLMVAAAGHAQAQGWSVTRLTDNDVIDAQPQVSGSSVVWVQWDGKDDEIFLAGPQSGAVPALSKWGAMLVAAFVLAAGALVTRRRLAGLHRLR
jgi:hypothetical protein